jgi:hypothetical protein
VDAIIFALIPTILFAVAGVVVIEHLRIKEGGQRYQHKEYRPEKGAGNGNGNGAASGNGHGPPGRRRRRRDGSPPPPGPAGDG